MTSKDRKGVRRLRAAIVAILTSKRAVFLAAVVILVTVTVVALLKSEYRDLSGRVDPRVHNHVVLVSLPLRERSFWQAEIASSSASPCEDCVRTGPRLGPGMYSAKVGLVKTPSIHIAAASLDVDRAVATATPTQPIKLKLIPIFTDGKLQPSPDHDGKVVYELTFAGFDRTSTVSIPFIVHDDATGCASMWISVWNETRTIALDAFAVNVLTGQSASSNDCEVDDNLRSSTVGGSASVLKSLGSNANWRPTISGSLMAPKYVGLHAFEIYNLGKLETRAILISESEEGTTVLGWKLRTTLTNLMHDSKLASMLSNARKDLDHHESSTRSQAYRRLADHLARGLFLTEDDGGVDGRNANQAYGVLRATFDQEPKSTLIGHFTTSGGSDGDDTFYIPLRLLTQASPPLNANVARFIYPIPGMHVDENACVSRWTVAVMPSLEAPDPHSQTALQRILGRPESSWVSKPITTISGLRSHLEAQHNEPPSQAPEGLLLLGHHSAHRGIYFAKDDDAIDHSEINRNFRPGSAAVMALCSTSAPTAADGIIKKITTKGISTVIASPFQVQESYSIRLMEEFLKELDSSYAKPSQPLISDLFDNANSRVAQQLGMPERAVQGFEFVLAGNPDAKICGSLKEPEHVQ